MSSIIEGNDIDVKKENSSKINEEDSKNGKNEKIEENNVNNKLEDEKSVEKNENDKSINKIEFKLNHNFEGRRYFSSDIFYLCGNIHDRNQLIIFWILYVIISTLVFLCGCIGIAFCQKNNKINWLLITQKMSYEYYFTPNYVILYILFVFMISCVLGVAIIMCLKGKVIKDRRVYDMAFSEFGKFLVVPLFFTLGIELIQIFQKSESKISKKDKVASKACGFVFCTFATTGYIFIYLQLGKCFKNVFKFFFKKCFLSSCISYHIYLFLNSITELAVDDDSNKRGKDINKHLRNISFTFIIVYSLIIGTGAFFFTDFVMAVYGLLFNIGFLINSGRTRSNNYFLIQRIKGNLACSIIFFIGFLALIIFIIFKKHYDLTM